MTSTGRKWSTGVCPHVDVLLGAESGDGLPRGRQKAGKRRQAMCHYQRVKPYFTANLGPGRGVLVPRPQPQCHCDEAEAPLTPTLG